MPLPHEWPLPPRTTKNSRARPSLDNLLRSTAIDGDAEFANLEITQDEVDEMERKAGDGGDSMATNTLRNALPVLSITLQSSPMIMERMLPRRNSLHQVIFSTTLCSMCRWLMICYSSKG